jgi:hypothetical protein
MRTLLEVRKPPVVPMVAWLRRVINTEGRSSALGAAGRWERRCRELRQPERHGISKARRAPMAPGRPLWALARDHPGPGPRQLGPGRPAPSRGRGGPWPEPGLGNAGRPGIMADLATQWQPRPQWANGTFFKFARQSFKLMLP